MFVNKKSCARINFTKTSSLSSTKIVAHDQTADQTAGLIIAEKDSPKLFYVSFIIVNDAYKRCGLGTRLYEMMAADACERGVKLQSDRRRSKQAQSFWQKQVDRGRAVCTRPSKYPDDEPTDASALGRGGCDRYALIGCPETLGNGTKRRRR